jgi:hypothetical protein
MRQDNGENYKMRRFTICITHQILRGDKIREDKMGGACGMYGYKQKYRQSIGAKISEGKKPHERPNCM